MSGFSEQHYLQQQQTITLVSMSAAQKCESSEQRIVGSSKEDTDISIYGDDKNVNNGGASSDSCGKGNANSIGDGHEYYDTSKYWTTSTGDHYVRNGDSIIDNRKENRSTSKSSDGFYDHKNAGCGNRYLGEETFPSTHISGGEDSHIEHGTIFFTGSEASGEDNHVYICSREDSWNRCNSTNDISRCDDRKGSDLNGGNSKDSYCVEENSTPTDVTGCTKDAVINFRTSDYTNTTAITTTTATTTVTSNTTATNISKSSNNTTSWTNYMKINSDVPTITSATKGTNSDARTSDDPAQDNSGWNALHFVTQWMFHCCQSEVQSTHHVQTLQKVVHACDTLKSLALSKMNRAQRYYVMPKDNVQQSVNLEQQKYPKYSGEQQSHQVKVEVNDTFEVEQGTLTNFKIQDETCSHKQRERDQYFQENDHQLLKKKKIAETSTLGRENNTQIVAKNDRDNAQEKLNILRKVVTDSKSLKDLHQPHINEFTCHPESACSDINPYDHHNESSTLFDKTYMELKNFWNHSPEQCPKIRQNNTFSCNVTDNDLCCDFV
eukprot:gene2451-8082_t